MPADRVDRYTKGIVFYWLFKQGVSFAPSTRLRAIEGRTVLAYNTHTGEERRIENVDTIVLSLGSRGDDSLYQALKGKVKAVYLAGSAFTPRRLAEATQHGANLGMLL